MTRTKKTSYVGSALANFWLPTLVGETASDSVVNWTKKTSNKGKPFAIFWLLTSVGETDSDSGATGTKKTSRLCHISIKR